MRYSNGNELARVSRPSMIVIEPDLFCRRTVHERPLPQISRRSEFPYSKGCMYVWPGGWIRRRRHVKCVVAWVSYFARASYESDRNREGNCESCCALHPHISFHPIPGLCVPWVA